MFTICSIKNDILKSKSGSPYVVAPVFRGIIFGIEVKIQLLNGFGWPLVSLLYLREVFLKK